MVTKNKGGGSLVQVDSKLFEISEELLNRKISGAIPQRGISFSPRMRFGEKDLSTLLERVEVQCQKDSLKVLNNSWIEGGRRYTLQSGVKLLVKTDVVSKALSVVLFKRKEPSRTANSLLTGVLKVSQYRKSRGSMLLAICILSTTKIHALKRQVTKCV